LKYKNKYDKEQFRKALQAMLEFTSDKKFGVKNNAVPNNFISEIATEINNEIIKNIDIDIFLENDVEKIRSYEEELTNYISRYTNDNFKKSDYPEIKNSGKNSLLWKELLPKLVKTIIEYLQNLNDIHLKEVVREEAKELTSTLLGYTRYQLNQLGDKGKSDLSKIEEQFADAGKFQEEVKALESENSRKKLQLSLNMAKILLKDEKNSDALIFTNEIDSFMALLTDLELNAEKIRLAEKSWEKLQHLFLRSDDSDENLEQKIFEGLTQNGPEKRKIEELLFTSYSYFINQGIKKYQLSEEEIFDAYTETILLAITRIENHTFQVGTSLETWLYQIFHNKCIDQLRKKTTNKYSIHHTSSINKALFQLSDNNKSFEQALVEKSEWDLLKQKINEMDGPCGQLLLLFAEGHSDKDISELMSFKNADVVKTSRLRCMQKLRELYKSI